VSCRHATPAPDCAAASTLVLCGCRTGRPAGEFSPGDGEIEPFLALQAVSSDGELHSRIRFALGIVVAHTGNVVADRKRSPARRLRRIPGCRVLYTQNRL
jgi:hypothetical protein